MPGILNPFRFGAASPPTLQAKVLTQATGTAVVGTTIVISGVGFPPKALMAWSSSAVANNTTGSGTVTRVLGFATSPSDRRVMSTLTVHNANPSNEAVEYRDDCIMILGANGVATGRLDVQSFDSDGVTLIVDEQFSATFLFSLLLLGGDKLTNCTTFQVQEAASTGDHAYTGLGFPPDVLLLSVAGGGTTTPPFETDHSILSFGFANATASAVLAEGGKDAASPSVRRSYIRSGECGASYDTAITGTDMRFSLTSLDADGFTLNFAERASSRWIFGLALKGPSSYVGNMTASTVLNTTQAQSGFGFPPVAVIGFANRAAQSTADTPVAATTYWTVGAFTSALSKRSHGARGTHNVTTTTAAKGMRDDTWIWTEAAGRLDIDSVDADGFTTIVDVADGVASYIPYLALG